LATVTSQSLKYEGINYTFSQNYTTWKRIG